MLWTHVSYIVYLKYKYLKIDVMHLLNNYHRIEVVVDRITATKNVN